MTSKINIESHSILGVIRSLFSTHKNNNVSLSERIPSEVQEHILRFLSPREVAAATGVQRSWRDYLSSDTNKKFLPKETNICIHGHYYYENSKIYQVTRCAIFGGKKPVSLQMRGQYLITNSGLKYLIDLPLREIDLRHSYKITNDGLKYLTGSPLKKLYLSECNITDPGLKHIARISSLVTLDLSECGLKPYAPFSALFTTSDSITHKGVKYLTHLPLKELLLRGCSINDEALKHIARISSLTKLDVSRTPITDEGLKYLVKCTSLKHLNLTSCHNITNISLRSLAFLSCLIDLNLTWCNNITDIDLVQFLGLRRAFYFFGAQQHITESGVFDKATDFQGGNYDHLYWKIASYLIPDSLQVNVPNALQVNVPVSL